MFFCYVIYNICQDKTKDLFRKIYLDFSKSTEEIDAYTQAYLPSEPENNSIDIEFLFY